MLVFLPRLSQQKADAFSGCPARGGYGVNFNMSIQPPSLGLSSLLRVASAPDGKEDTLLAPPME